MNYTKVTERQYNRILNKLGKPVKIDGVEYNVLFKKSSSKNASEQLIIGYPQSYGWKKGTIFEFHGDYYLIINRDATESDVYYTSLAKKCNITIFGRYHLVAGDLSSPNPKNGTVTEITGAIMLYTCTSEMLKIGEIINEFGGWWKCVNIFHIDGLSYYYFTRQLEVSSASWDLVRITDDSTFNVGTEGDVRCKLKANNVTQTNTLYDTGATFTYSSSNDEIATVTDEGIVTGIDVGTVTIICTSIGSNGKNYTLEIPITIVASGVSITDKLVVSYTGTTEAIKVGGSGKTFQAIYTVDGVQDVETIPSWSFVVIGAESDDVRTNAVVEQGNYPYRIKVTIPDTTITSKWLGKRLKVTATYPNGMTGDIVIPIVSF